MRSRTETPFGRVIGLFIAFIMLCGATHVLDIVNIWIPMYWLSAMVNVATACVSVATASVLIPMIPKMVKIPDPYLDLSTSLPNRVVLLDRIEQANLRAARCSGTFALIFINYDLTTPTNFPPTRNIGDVVLAAAAERLRAAIRSTDTVALSRGTEFVILAEELGDDSHLSDLTALVLAEAVRPLPIGSQRVALSARLSYLVADGRIPAATLLHESPRMTRDRVTLRV